MIPETLLNDTLTISEGVETSWTYKVTSDNIRGYTDGIEALQQAIYKVLNTEKYEYPIYNYSYGIDIESLIGKDAAYVRVELKRRIQECLLQDERIQTVDNFQISVEGDALTCAFNVTSIYGDITITKAVNF
jgi:hypothetical protein